MSVLALLGLKALLGLSWISDDVLKEQLAGSEMLLKVYVLPYDLVVPWQLAEGLGAALTFTLLLFADAAIPRLEAGA